MSLRTLLDEALPLDLVGHLREAGFEIEPFPSAWRGLTDGRMLDAFEEEGGGVLVTCDRNIRFQQSFGRRGIGLVVLPGQRLAHLVPLIERIVPILRAATFQDIIVVERDGRAVHHSA